MKAFLIFGLVILQVELLAQSSTQQKELQAAITGLKNSLTKRDFNLLKPFLDENYAMGEVTRPKADKIIPQLLAQMPELVDWKIEKTEFLKEGTVITIEYKNAGHMFGTNKSTSVCELNPSTNKFKKIEHFDTAFQGAVKKKQ